MIRSCCACRCVVRVQLERAHELRASDAVCAHRVLLQRREQLSEVLLRDVRLLQ
jgi:hypothetical protein